MKPCFAFTAVPLLKCFAVKYTGKVLLAQTQLVTLKPQDHCGLAVCMSQQSPAAGEKIMGVHNKVLLFTCIRKVPWCMYNIISPSTGT